MKEKEELKDLYEQEQSKIKEEDLPNDQEELKKQLIESKKNELYLKYQYDCLMKGK